jgi:DNA-binding winged helix-turn-helix (wHTH) protein/Tol biopolymer transport system component
MYEVDLHTGELWRSGYRVKLQSQPFKVLTILLERPGDIVTREELQRRLWGGDTIVDFDHSLATAINKIREALRDSAENPRFVETLARRGYRFIAPVTRAGADEAASPAGLTARSVESEIADTLNTESPTEQDGEPLFISQKTQPPSPFPSAQEEAYAGSHGVGIKLRTPKRRFQHFAAGLLTGLAITVSVWYSLGSWHPATVPPHMTQLTHSGHLATAMNVTENLMASVTDGYRLFVPVIEAGRTGVATLPVAGGSPVSLSLPDEVASPMLGDISPDGSRLLLRNHLSPESEQPLWVVPTNGGSALRVGAVLAHDATWMPDGAGILYAAGNDLYLTDVTNSRSLVFASLPGRAFWLRWSPSGKLLRFTVIDPIAHTESLWQLSAASRKPQQILQGFLDPPMECCGVWTGDGNSFVFQSTSSRSTDLWKLAGDATSHPTRLTDGPLQFQSPVAARGGNTIFFVGVDSRSQLERLSSAGELIPVRSFLASAVRVEFSRDRRWVVWNDIAGRLWRSAADGTQKLQLTPDALDVFIAHWSPDGSRLAFMAREPGKAWKIYLVSADGGDIQPLLKESRNAADPSWSQDSQFLVFGRVNDALGKENAARTLQILNLRTNAVEEVPGSDGLFSPRWSPDGRYIAALSLDQREVRLYDLENRNWKTLPVHSGADPVWSPDSRYLYLHESLDPTQPIDRISIPQGSVQQLVRLSSSQEGDAVDYLFGGIDLENQPLVLARTFTGNLYSLQVR